MNHARPTELEGVDRIRRSIFESLISLSAVLLPPESTVGLLSMPYAGDVLRLQCYIGGGVLGLIASGDNQMANYVKDDMKSAIDSFDLVAMAQEPIRRR